MDNLSVFFYIFAGTSSLLTGILGLWLNTIMPDIDHWSRKFFRVFFIIIVLSSLSSFIEEILYFVTTQFTAIYTVWIFEGLLFSLPCPMLTIYMLYCSGEGMQRNKLLRTSDRHATSDGRIDHTALYGHLCVYLHMYRAFGCGYVRLRAFRSDRTEPSLSA